MKKGRTKVWPFLPSRMRLHHIPDLVDGVDLVLLGGAADDGFLQRDRMAEHLRRRGIDSARYLDGIAGEARARYGYAGDCPNAERLSATVLLVPIHYNLRRSDMERLADSINEGALAL